MVTRRWLFVLSVVLAPLAARAQSTLEARYGGPWHASFSPRDGTLRFLAAPGVPEAQAEALVADVARLAGADPDDLVLARVGSRVQDGVVRELRRWDRYYRGTKVEGDEVMIAVTAGRIGGVWVRLGPLAGVPTPRAGEEVLRLPSGRAVVARRVMRPGRIEWLDRSGVLVHEVPTWIDANLTVTVEEYAPGDALVTGPARDVVVTDGVGGRELTGDDGVTALTGPFDVELDGTHITIELDGEPVRATAVADDDLLAGTDIAHEAAMVMHHYGAVRDWLVARRGPTPDMDEHVRAAVDDESLLCNAYYDNISDRFGFSPAVQGCPAMARFGDIVAHEAGHRIHWVIRVGGAYALDISEGSSDYVSATLHGESMIAAGVNGPGNPLRDIGPDRVYPRDVFGEQHNDGLIWASFLWDLRVELSQQLGDEEGPAVTDRIFLGALEQGPEMTEVWSAVFVADDDDGDLANGTPHDCTILELLEEHGLGPGSLGAVRIQHDVPAGIASDATSIPLSFTETTAFPGCAQASTLSATLWTTTAAGVDLPVAGVEDPAWTSLPLALVDGAWVGDAPRRPANTNLRYFVEVTRDDGGVIRTARTIDEVWSVWVGDRRVVWCDDFDGEPTGWRSGVGVPYSDDIPFGATNDWEIGEPSGAPGEPSEAHSGQQIAGTWLDGDYLPDNAEQFVSPELELATVGVMRLVTFARWLAVEDGLYDQAGVWALGPGRNEWTNLWTNHATQAGNTALVDADWTLQRYDLSPVLGDDGSRVDPLQIAFTLETDQGLEFAGWSIDDVCIEELDAPERHYQVRDLEVALVPTDDPARPDVSLRWSVPWIQPVAGVAVLRKEGSAPTDVGDGARLRAPPQEDWVRWGETLEVLDQDPGPGEWHYAVLLAGRGRASEWWDAVVPGENEGTVTIEGGEEPDAGTPEPDAGEPDPRDAGPPDAGPPPSDDDDDDGGCGCTVPAKTGPSSALWTALLLGLALLLSRRRRTQRSGDGVP